MVSANGRSRATAAIGLSMSIPELLAIVQYSIDDAGKASTILGNLGVGPSMTADVKMLSSGFSELVDSHVMEMDYTASVPRFADIDVNTPESTIGMLVFAKILSVSDSFVSIRMLLGKAQGSLHLFTDDESWVLIWMQGASAGRHVSLSYGLSKANMVDTVWSKLNRHFTASTPKAEITVNIVRIRANTGEIMSGTSLFGSNPEFMEPELSDPVLSHNTGSTVMRGLYLYPTMAALRKRVETILEVI